MHADRSYLKKNVSFFHIFLFHYFFFNNNAISPPKVQNIVEKTRVQQKKNVTVIYTVLCNKIVSFFL